MLGKRRESKGKDKMMGKEMRTEGERYYAREKYENGRER